MDTSTKAPSNPKSEKQVEQRTKFAFVMQFLSNFRELFNYTFAKTGGFNEAFKIAMRMAVNGSSPDFSIDFSKLVITIGTVKTPTSVIGSVTSATTLNLNWYTGDVGNKASASYATDQLNLVFYNADKTEVLLFENCADRIAGFYEQQLPETWLSDTLQCWLYFSREDGSKLSNSKFVGEFILK